MLHGSSLEWKSFSLLLALLTTTSVDCLFSYSVGVSFDDLSSIDPYAPFKNPHFTFPVTGPQFPFTATQNMTNLDLN